jgi:hypothetical protein
MNEEHAYITGCADRFICGIDTADNINAKAIDEITTIASALLFVVEMKPIVAFGAFNSQSRLEGAFFALELGQVAKMAY